MAEELVMEHLMAKFCFGDKNGDPDVLCYEDQFLEGLNKFQGLFPMMWMQGHLMERRS